MTDVTLFFAAIFTALLLSEFSPSSETGPSGDGVSPPYPPLGSPRRMEDDMTTKDLFRRMLRERRLYPRGSDEWDWRTRAARKYAWILRGVPVNEWSE